MLAQFVVNKLTGVAVCVAAIVFYFGGTMELPNCLLMLICSFILFEQLDSAGSFSALFRSDVYKRQSFRRRSSSSSQAPSCTSCNMDMR